MDPFADCATAESLVYPYTPTTTSSTTTGTPQQWHAPNFVKVTPPSLPQITPPAPANAPLPNGPLPSPPSLPDKDDYQYVVDEGLGYVKSIPPDPRLPPVSVIPGDPGYGYPKSIAPGGRYYDAWGLPEELINPPLEERAERPVHVGEGDYIHSIPPDDLPFGGWEYRSEWDHGYPQSIAPGGDDNGDGWVVVTPTAPYEVGAEPTVIANDDDYVHSIPPDELPFGGWEYRSEWDHGYPQSIAPGGDDNGYGWVAVAPTAPNEIIAEPTVLANDEDYVHSVPPSKKPFGQWELKSDDNADGWRIQIPTVQNKARGETAETDLTDPAGLLAKRVSTTASSSAIKVSVSVSAKISPTPLSLTSTTATGKSLTSVTLPNVSRPPVSGVTPAVPISASSAPADPVLDYNPPNVNDVENDEATAPTDLDTVRAARDDLEHACPEFNSTMYASNRDAVYEIECGVDRSGGDLHGPVYVRGFAACVDVCDATPGCVLVAYPKADYGPCYVKKLVGAPGRKANIWGARRITRVTAPSGNSTEGKAVQSAPNVKGVLGKEQAAAGTVPAPTPTPTPNPAPYPSPSSSRSSLSSSASSSASFGYYSSLSSSATTRTSSHRSRTRTRQRTSTAAEYSDPSTPTYGVTISPSDLYSASAISAADYGSSSVSASADYGYESSTSVPAATSSDYSIGYESSSVSTSSDYGYEPTTSVLSATSSDYGIDSSSASVSSVDGYYTPNLNSSITSTPTLVPTPGQYLKITINLHKVITLTNKCFQTVIDQYKNITYGVDTALINGHPTPSGTPSGNTTYAPVHDVLHPSVIKLFLHNVINFYQPPRQTVCYIKLCSVCPITPMLSGPNTYLIPPLCSAPSCPPTVMQAHPAAPSPISPPPGVPGTCKKVTYAVSQCISCRKPHFSPPPAHDNSTAGGISIPPNHPWPKLPVCNSTAIAYPTPAPCPPSIAPHYPNSTFPPITSSGPSSAPPQPQSPHYANSTSPPSTISGEPQPPPTAATNPPASNPASNPANGGGILTVIKPCAECPNGSKTTAVPVVGLEPSYATRVVECPSCAGGKETVVTAETPRPVVPGNEGNVGGDGGNGNGEGNGGVNEGANAGGQGTSLPHLTATRAPANGLTEGPVDGNDAGASPSTPPLSSVATTATTGLVAALIAVAALVASALY